MTHISRAPKRAYVQGDGMGNFYSLSCRAVAEDLRERGYLVEMLNPKRLPPKWKITGSTPLKGTTGIVQYLYERAFGVAYPNFDIPEALSKYAQRKFYYATLGEIRARPPSAPQLFIKPAKQAKLFPAAASLYYSEHLPDSTPVLAQERVYFSCEARAFAGEFGIKFVTHLHLAGNVRRRLWPFARKLHRKWGKEAPRAYVLDVGLIKQEGKDVLALVEVNSVLTAGNMSSLHNPGKVLIQGWESYVRYAERGEF